MQSIKKTAKFTGILAAVALASAFAYQAMASRSFFMGPTTVVAVDLPAVLAGLQQRSVAETELVAMGERIRTEGEQWQTELKAMDTQIKELPETETAAKSELEDRLMRKALEFQEWQRFKAEQADIEKSLLMQDLYMRIRGAITEMAEIEGYDIVLMDDSKDPLSLNPDARASRDAQVRQQIRTKRVLYSSPAVDITDALIERMNNAFAAGG